MLVNDGGTVKSARSASRQAALSVMPWEKNRHKNPTRLNWIFFFIFNFVFMPEVMVHFV